jgi:hypothetical protein
MHRRDSETSPRLAGSMCESLSRYLKRIAY